MPLALTITTNEGYYLVTPNNSKDIYKTVRNTSKLKGIVGNQKIKVVATHYGTYKYNYTVKYDQDRCYISNLSVLFNSKITLPKIDLNAKKYTKNTTNKLRRITKNNSTFATCKDLNSYIKQEFIQTSQIIKIENSKFDCLEYGIKQGLKSCETINSSIVSNKSKRTQKIKTSDFSSLTQGGKSDIKIYKDGVKPNKEDCDGQLIEPFKGKFYCVPATNYSELW